MEPMVIFALGIVVYCRYLTVKDIVADLYQEGFMVRSLFNKCLGYTFGNTFWRFFLSRSWSRSRIITNSPMYSALFITVREKAVDIVFLCNFLDICK
jgi:hypothetical protein